MDQIRRIIENKGMEAIALLSHPMHVFCHDYNHSAKNTHYLKDVLVFAGTFTWSLDFRLSACITFNRKRLPVEKFPTLNYL